MKAMTMSSKKGEEMILIFGMFLVAGRETTVLSTKSWTALDSSPKREDQESFAAE